MKHLKRFNESREIDEIKEIHLDLVRMYMDKDDNIVEIETNEDGDGIYFTFVLDDLSQQEKPWPKYPNEYKGYRIKIEERPDGV